MKKILHFWPIKLFVYAPPSSTLQRGRGASYLFAKVTLDPNNTLDPYRSGSPIALDPRNLELSVLFDSVYTHSSDVYSGIKNEHE